MPTTRKQSRIELVLALLAMGAAAVSPNLFVAAQAGYAKLSDLAVVLLIPSVFVMVLVLAASTFLRMRVVRHQVITGIIGGFIATAAMEIVRETGFHLGGMPGDMPKLLGVLLLDRFALGPSWLSNMAGWAYHFWNGAAFGIIFSLVFGRAVWWIGVLYATVIAVIFMSSPAVVAMGVGHFGVDFGPAFATTVLLAHIAYGATLGWFIRLGNIDTPSILDRVRQREF